MIRVPARRSVGAIAIAMPILLVTFLAFPSLRNTERAPEDVVGMARWLTERPADWLVASRLTDQVLNGKQPNRIEIWRASHALAMHLAPERSNTAAAFVRSGLMNWEQLDPGEQRAVIDAVQPLLADYALFVNMSQPLLDLTGDFAMLRRSGPQSIAGILYMRDLAAANGLAKEYHALQDDVRTLRMRDFETRRTALTPAELLGLLSFAPTTADEPLIRAVLDELRKRPVDVNPSLANIQELIDFLIDHKIGPLEGLQFIALSEDSATPPTRARLALAVGDPSRASQIETGHGDPATPGWREYHVERALFEAKRGDATAALMQLERASASGAHPETMFARAEVARLRGDAAAEARALDELAPYSAPRWQGLCAGGDICRNIRTEWFTPGARSMPLQLAVVQSDSIMPYVEIYLDDALIAEGDVPERRRFDVKATTAGVHRLELRVINPLTKSQADRRMRFE